jgi:hypothetical protein
VTKAQPLKTEMTDKEKARARREKLERLAAENNENIEVVKKRDAKLQSK